LIDADYRLGDHPPALSAPKAGENPRSGPPMVEKPKDPDENHNATPIAKNVPRKKGG
jgi:hypothetical protein